MEESITILDEINKRFGCKDVDIRTYSPLTLAYIGDAVYDLIIRSVIVKRANKPPDKLHKTVIKYVNAKTQANMIEALEDELSEEEMAVYHRGRNAKSYTKAKNASIVEYRKATGLEALFGYLYLDNRMDRLFSLICLGLEKMELTI